MITAFIIIFSSVLPITAGAVNYPEGVTQQQAEEVIPKLNNIAKGLLAGLSGRTDYKDSVYEMLYSDDTLNSLFAGIYEALGENADTLSSIGVDVSPAALSKALSNYPSISKKLAGCKSLSDAVSASKSFKWDVSSKNGFKNAVAAMLSPFNELLNVVLCSGSLKINDIISIAGDDGYTTAIVPLLKAFDCPTIMSSSEFSASAAKNRSNIIKNILSMVFDALDKLLDDPVKGMCETLPKIAYYFNSDKLSQSISALIEPLSLKIAGIFTIPGLSDLIGSVANLEDSMNINELLGNTDLSSLTGGSAEFRLPEIDLAALASTVTESEGSYTVDKGAAFIIIMNFAIDALKLNKDSLGGLTGAEADGTDILSGFLSKSNDEIISSLVKLFSVKSAPENNYQWNYPVMTPGYVTYTPTLTAEDYNKILDKFDGLLTDFVRESDPDSDIEQTLRKTIYSNKTLSEIVIGIYSVIGSEETAGLFSILGMNVTPQGVASSIASSYPYAASVLSKYSGWEKINPSSLSWGFRDGDSERFQAALSKVMSPFVPLLSCVLAGSDVTFMNAITIPGANGYNTAVIPLLEALGCKSESIKTYSEYVSGAGTNKVLTDIFTPVFELIDEICASPVKTICRLLPNLIYFFENGLMEDAITNLLYPITYMLSEAGMSDLLDTSALMSMEELDMSQLLGGLTSSMDMEITLPELDLSVIGTYGTPTTLTSKRVVNGQYAQYTYVTADTSAVLVTLMRVLVSVMTSEENGDMFANLMGGSSDEGGNDMFAMYAGDISKKFEGMTSDEVLEWLCDLFFSDTPTKDIEDDDVIPEIVYKKRFRLSTTAKIIILVVICALAALIYYILSVSGKLDKMKLRRSKKKEMKRKEKETQRLIKAGAKIPAAESKKAKAPKASKPKTAQKPAAQKPVAQKPAAQKPAVQQKPAAPKPAAPKPASMPGSAAPDTASQQKRATPDSILLNPLSPTGKASENTAPVTPAPKTVQQKKASPAIKPQVQKPMTEKELRKEEKLLRQNEAKDMRLATARYPDEKEAAKLEHRHQQAMKKAEKNAVKAQKQYEKILKQAAKQEAKKKK